MTLWGQLGPFRSNLHKKKQGRQRDSGIKYRLFGDRNVPTGCRSGGNWTKENPPQPGGFFCV